VAPDGWSEFKTGLENLVPPTNDELVLADKAKTLGGINILLNLYATVPPKKQAYGRLPTRAFIHHDALADGAKFDWGMKRFRHGEKEYLSEVPVFPAQGEYVVCGRTNHAGGLLIACTSYMDASKVGGDAFDPSPYVSLIKQILATASS
jgi:hypothetical protein